MLSRASLLVLGLLTLPGAAGAAEPARAGTGRAETAIGYGSYRESGIASWYGEELKGNRTASGDRFDPDAMTAAHRTLPLGSFLEVTSLDTGRSILVRVNDRGPGHKGRVIDLSRGAARLLGIERRPLARVGLRAIVPTADDQATLRAGRAVAAREADAGFVRAASTTLPPRPAPAPVSKNGRYVLQVASFSNRARAEELATRIGGELTPAGILWRVRLGPFKGAAAAQDARDAIAARGYGDAQILPLD